MSVEAKLLQAQAAQAAQGPNASPQISAALRNAARKTGTSFEYLLATAKIESGLNPGAKASSSSAHGLFQFIEQTWLAALKDYGPAHGYAQHANAIVQTETGRYEVPDARARDAIMRLRSDPAASAAMAGAFTRNNTAQLTEVLGRKPSEGELYIAHFLGADGASRLIDAAVRSPKAKAADLFPGAAAANPSIFHDRSGRALSVRDVYGKLAGKFEVARGADVPLAPAALRGTLPAATSPRLPDTAGIARVLASADNRPPVSDTKPLFQAMFTNDREGRAIAPVVSSLWTSGDVALPPSVNSYAPVETDKPDVRRLFSDKGS